MCVDDIHHVYSVGCGGLVSMPPQCTDNATVSLRSGNVNRLLSL